MFAKLPREVLEVIIQECAIIDLPSVAALAATSHEFHELISHAPDQHLWRNIFLDIFDDPRPALSLCSGEPLEAISYDWKSATQRRYRASCHLQKAAMADIDEGDNFDEFVDDETVNAIMEVAFQPQPGFDQPSLNYQWLNEALKGSVFPDADTQNRAKLHFLAAFLESTTSVSLPSDSNAESGTRLASRAFTYDLRHYMEEYAWGPWIDQGITIDWIHVWHLVDVVRHNAHERRNIEFPIPRLTHLRPHSCEVTEDRAGERGLNDWAGVEGVWARTVCFMDYRDLQAYNYSTTTPGGILDTSIFRDPHFAEAFRLIRAQFMVTHVEDVGPKEHPNRPTIHFVGDYAISEEPYDYSLQRISQGTVSMTPAGHVRWTFTTKVAEHRWLSEGVQMGGVKSAAGVIGTWSSADHDDEDPAGPFWLWKVDREAKPAMKSRLHYQIVIHT